MKILPVRKSICLVLYYGFARFLPASIYPLGKVCRLIRYLVCFSLFKTCGKNVNIESRAYFGSGEKISIGDNSGIGINARIRWAATIGKNVMMAPDVVILSKNHSHNSTDIPMIDQGYDKEKPVTIGDDVWIGTRVIILPGVSVGSGSILGAGAVITKDVPSRSVVVGNPARVVGLRGADKNELK
jgi:maltose O-acetyltransferase